jgi:hypothetical protein
MRCPETLNIALKEWASVCRALETSRQIILLRKGGIYESSGEFTLENQQFLLFPTYLHQNLNMLKPSEHAAFQPATVEPAQVQISSAAAVTDIIPITIRAAMDALDDQHIWTKPLIDMRFNYRPENPLYLLFVRAYRLPKPVTIQNTPAYAGCKSWVPLSAPVATETATAALDDAAYAARRQLILDRLERFCRPYGPLD